MMASMVLKRTGAALAVLVVVSALTFIALHVVPGDAAILELGLDASPEKVAALRASMGTDVPLPQQYLNWLGGVLVGDWGRSSQYGAGVLEVIGSALPVTVSLAIYATLLAVVISLVLGVAAALHPGSVVDVIARTVIQMGSAAPGFLLGVVLMLVFGLWLGWFPVSGYTPLGQGLVASLRSLTVPAFALAISECGVLVRVVRSSVMSSLSRDYMLSTQVKGLSRLRTIVGYALRGALVAPLTVAGIQFAKLLGGTAVIESVFALPGLGRLLLTAVAQRDVMLMQGVVLFVTVAVVLVTLLVDLAIFALDPSTRERQGRSS